MSRYYNVSITKTALKEAEEIYHWIAEENAAAAKKWQSELLDAIDTLQEFPERCSSFKPDTGKKQPLRQLIYGNKRENYRIVFEIRRQTVYITRVIHSARENI